MMGYFIDEGAVKTVLASISACLIGLGVVIGWVIWG